MVAGETEIMHMKKWKMYLLRETFCGQLRLDDKCHVFFHHIIVYG